MTARITEYLIAKVRFNNANGALLCNTCEKVICAGFDHEDRAYYCSVECEPKTSLQKNINLSAGDDLYIVFEITAPPLSTTKAKKKGHILYGNSKTLTLSDIYRADVIIDPDTGSVLKNRFS
jgi:hypothetical protein